MQQMDALANDTVHSFYFPCPSAEVQPGVRWGRFDELLSPAYWAGQCWQHQLLGSYGDLRLGQSLSEEMSACLLGGYGIRAELGLAAFARLRDEGLLTCGVEASHIEHALARPFALTGGTVRYRFPRQKARYLSNCLRETSNWCIDKICDRELRDQLTTLPGIGLKTASWIVRNLRHSVTVAVIDIHVLNAGRYMGIFDPACRPQRHYKKLETQFLDFAQAIEVPAWLLDAIMWEHMSVYSAARLWEAKMRDAPPIAISSTGLSIR